VIPAWFAVSDDGRFTGVNPVVSVDPPVMIVRMKILIISSVLTVIAMTAFSEPPPTAELPGRYQVVTGRLEYATPSLTSNASNERVINSAILIDTATGKTWFLEPVARQVTDKKGTVFMPDRQWSEIKLKE